MLYYGINSDVLLNLKQAELQISLKAISPDVMLLLLFFNLTSLAIHSSASQKFDCREGSSHV